MINLPPDWTPEAIKATEILAKYFGADPRGILAIWNSESGLYPRLSKAGYYGLIMGREEFVSPAIGESWINLVNNGSVAAQIGAIAKFWDHTAKAVLGGDTIIHRAQKLGIRGDTLIYALNFVPAYAAKMTSASQPMVISTAKGGGPDGGVFYHDNPGFDLTGKGYIDLYDIQQRIDKMKVSGSAAPRTSSLFQSISSGSLATVLGILGALAVGALAFLGLSRRG